MEITWHNGKKLLDSRNTNYSYGSLQRILKFGLEQIDLQNVKEVLLLGLGGGSVIETLRNDYHYQYKITAVEMDRKVIEICNTEFGISPNDFLEIIHDDAFHFVNHVQNFYDLVIIDLFIDKKVPEQFLTNEFLKKMESLTAPSGFIIFNASLTPAEINSTQSATAVSNTKMSYQTFHLVEGTNTLIIGQKKLQD